MGVCDWCLQCSVSLKGCNKRVCQQVFFHRCHKITMHFPSLLYPPTHHHTTTPTHTHSTHHYTNTGGQGQQERLAHPPERLAAA